MQLSCPKARQVASLIVWLTALAGCRSTGGDESKALELEDSLAVCADLQALAGREQASGMPLEEAFRTVKARERRILDDLTERTTGERRAGYERQRARLDACAPSAVTGDEAAAAAARNEEKRRTLIDEIAKVQSLDDLCRIAETTALKRANVSACKAEVLKSACQRAAEGTIGTGTVSDALAGEYRGALTTCVRSLAGDEAALAAETFAVELKRELHEGQDLDTALLVAACRSGAKVVGNRLDSVPEVDFDNACGTLGSREHLLKKSRIASCLRTTTDLCEIFVSHRGMALDRLIPVGEAGEAGNKEQILRALYRGIDDSVCMNGPTAHLACRTIGEAADQILQAVKTGNNDWAHCAGTDQLGACIGTLWGSGGFTNNNGVETAETVGNQTYRGCCWCYKDHFANDGWVSDTRIRRENWFGVIQGGDVATGNCKQMETKTGAGEGRYQGYETYYRYADCDRWYVAGDSCAAPAGVHRVWDSKKKVWFPVRVP